MSLPPTNPDSQGSTGNKAAQHAVPEALIERIRQGSRFLLTSHISPDGDAIGSELGLAQVLKALGKEVTIWNRDATPTAYLPLIGSGEIHVGEEPPAGFPETFDAAIPLECPSLDRCGLAEQVSKLPLLNIDHHLGNDEYGEILWIDTKAPAVGAMIYRLAQAMNVSIDAETATALYLTLVTDTGGFRFSNATPEAFESAAALVREGARPEQVSHWLFESNPESAIRLQGEVLQTLELHRSGTIATAWLKRDMVERTGATPGDAEGLIDIPRSIAGVETVALIKELPDNKGFKVSLRSRGQVNVEQIARSRGGGGHRNAAGFTALADNYPRTPDELQSELVEAMGLALSQDS